MKRRERIRLEFCLDREKRPALQRMILEAPGWPPVVSEAVASSARRGFVWNLHGGFPRVLALMLVRVARWRFQEMPAGTLTLPLAEGTARPCAATRFGDLAALTQSAWLAETLSPLTEARDAHARLNRWFITRHVHGRPGGPGPRVELRLHELRPDDVDISLDGAPAPALRLDWIETRLAAAIDGSLPPLPSGARPQLAGFLPSVGADFWGREEELSAISALYADPACRLIEVVAGGGEGKTAIARAWLRQTLGMRTLREAVIFSWSFYRQGYTQETRQSLWAFYRRLGEALGVSVQEGMLPRRLLSTLIDGLHATPVLLMLDGLEVLVRKPAAGSAETISTPPEEARDGRENQATLAFQDATLGPLLSALSELPAEKGGIALITSRVSIAGILGEKARGLRSLALGPLMAPHELSEVISGLESSESGTGLDPATRETPRSGADALTLALQMRQPAPAATPAGQNRLETRWTAPSPDLPPPLVRTIRRGMEQLAHTPEATVLALASLFDRPAEWEAILAVVQSPAGAGRLTEPWRTTTVPEWEEARERLQEQGWTLPSADGLVALHPLVQRCIGEDLRRANPVAWIEAHRRLYEYFSAQPEKYLPETLEELAPLLRACWHGCQAGDFQKAYREIADPRISRRQEAYIVFSVGAYEETINLVNFFTEDGESFPGTDLDERERTGIAHAYAVCLRYLDRLEEALRVETSAWRRALQDRNDFLLPIATNLLRLQHIFGRLNETGPALRSLLRGLFAGNPDQRIEGTSRPSWPMPSAMWPASWRSS